jgi:hypothetical protein
MQIITVHTEGSTVIINDLVRIECKDEENANLFAASFESDVYHHTETVVNHVGEYVLIAALKECVDYISNDIEEHGIGLSDEDDRRKWLAGLQALVEGRTKS